MIIPELVENINIVAAIECGSLSAFPRANNAMPSRKKNNIKRIMPIVDFFTLAQAPAARGMHFFTDNKAKYYFIDDKRGKLQTGCVAVKINDINYIGF